MSNQHSNSVKALKEAALMRLQLIDLKKLTN